MLVFKIRNPMGLSKMERDQTRKQQIHMRINISESISYINYKKFRLEPEFSGSFYSY